LLHWQRRKPASLGAANGANGMEFMKSLSPLEGLKKHVSVFKGLWNPTTVEGEGGHYPKMNVLCGLKVKKTTTDVGSRHHRWIS